MSKHDSHQEKWRKFREAEKGKTAPASQRSTKRQSATPRLVSQQQQSVGKGNIMEVKMNSDVARIGMQASRVKKHELQTALLPSYSDYLAEAMKNPTGGDDPVLVQCMIWAFNTGDLEQGRQLADHAIQHGLSMPDNFKATVKQFLCREVAYWSLAQQKEGNDPEPHLSEVFKASRNWDKPDQIESRLLKARAQHIIEQNAEAALDLFELAAKLDDRAGVSQVIKRLKKQLAKEPTAGKQQ